MTPNKVEKIIGEPDDRGMLINKLMASTVNCIMDKLTFKGQCALNAPRWRLRYVPFFFFKTKWPFKMSGGLESKRFQS